MNICSLVVHARPDSVDVVREQLMEFSGVEVHGEADGRMVVTVEHEERKVVSEAIMEFNNVQGVLSSALIYEYSGEFDTEELEQETTQQEVSQ